MSHKSDIPTFSRLKKAVKNFNADEKAFDIRSSKRVALVGDTATQFLATAIRGTGLLRGIDLQLFDADYNQVERQTLDPDFVIIFQSSHRLAGLHASLDDGQRRKMADQRIEFLKTICNDTPLSNKKIIYLNYPEIDDVVFGSYSNKVESSLAWQTRKLNFMLMELAAVHPNLMICDLAAIQNKIGRDTMFSPNVYVSTDMVLSIDSLPIVASRIVDIIDAVVGSVCKCLVLDLDNTLWGGVVGDDGVSGIHLGHGLGIGKAFTEFQAWVKKLQERGIIICVVSKNNEETAKEPFEKHPDMVLHLSDIAIFIANWENKVDNIRQVQRILNIGFDSMVFIDDNPFEREMVRKGIPEIIVPEMPSDPALYLEYLYSLNLFETASYSTEDGNRTRQYQQEAERTAVMKTFKDENDFLMSLDMRSTVEGLTDFNLPRVAQLSQRSNQFNLRTVRYTEADLLNMVNDNAFIPLTFTLDDRFGDNGLVSVVILRQTAPDTLFIDTWIMSCRVLKRGMEQFVMNTVVDEARRAGCRLIVGEYIPTPKNKLVEHLLPDMGFEQIESHDSNSTFYQLNVDEYGRHQTFIENYK